MKTVYRSTELAHVWAHNNATDSYGRAAAHISFRGDCFYSYSTGIARKVRNKRGAIVGVALNTTSYSNTTSGHQRRAYSAIRHLPVFHVRGFSYGCSMAEVSTPAGVVAWLTAEAAQVLNQPASRYAWKRAEQVTNAAAAFRAAIAAAEVLKCGAAKARRELAKLGDLSAAAELLKVREEKRRETEARREKEKQALRAALIAEMTPLWLAGEDCQLPYGMPTLARLEQGDEGQELVTTHGARVPLDHVRRALPLVLSIIAAGKTYTRNGHTIHLGQYALDAITEAGEVVAGCHRFSKAEVFRIAGLLGVAVPVALPVDTADKAELIKCS